MRGRAWLVLLAVVAAAGAALAQVPTGPTYLPTRETACWKCHDAPVGGAPAVGEFAAILPPAAVEAALGEPFDYAVHVQNAWSGEVTYAEPGLDLSAAPALGFVSDVPPVRVDLDEAIPVDPARPTANHSRAIPLQLSEGLTYLRIAVQPADTDPLTGPDLVLRVRAGQAEELRDEKGRGEVEELVVADRSGFAGRGYGEWLVTAEVTPVPVSQADPLAIANGSLAVGDIPFHLTVEGEARDLPDRVLSLPMRVSLPADRSLTATFRLVAMQPPGAGESALATLKGHIHFTHNPSTAGAVDDADFLSPAAPVHVSASPTGSVLLGSTVVAPPTAVHNGPTMATVAEAVGYASGFLLVSSTWAGGMFGKASRRQLNVVFGSAKRRVAFHNFVSYGLIVAALSHAVLFLVEVAYGWTVGLLWGGLAVLAMLGLGATGALQVPMIRRWSFGAWRWSHWALAIGAVLLTIAHVALDGVHFGEVQETLGWNDPLAQAVD